MLEWVSGTAPAKEEMCREESAGINREVGWAGKGTEGACCIWAVAAQWWSLHLITTACPACTHPPHLIPYPRHVRTQCQLLGEQHMRSSCWSPGGAVSASGRGCGFRASEGGISAGSWNEGVFNLQPLGQEQFVPEKQLLRWPVWVQVSALSAGVGAQLTHGPCAWCQLLEGLRVCTLPKTCCAQREGQRESVVYVCVCVAGGVFTDNLQAWKEWKLESS